MCWYVCMMGCHEEPVNLCRPLRGPQRSEVMELLATGRVAEAENTAPPNNPIVPLLTQTKLFRSIMIEFRPVATTFPSESLFSSPEKNKKRLEYLIPLSRLPPHLSPFLPPGQTPPTF